MANKICFFSDYDTCYREEIVEFKYIKGMAFSQKQKNVLSFHKSISELYPDKKILEVSTKSDNPKGVSLSAFNLKLNGISIECIFQASKVFEGGVKFDELINFPPKEAHKFIAENEHGKLINFSYEGQIFPLEPKSMFYDYIYISAMIQHSETSSIVSDYDIFTDIEFNEKKSINCQARSCAIYSYMLKTNTVDYYMSSKDRFVELYKYHKKPLNSGGTQLSFII